MTCSDQLTSTLSAYGAKKGWVRHGNEGGCSHVKTYLLVTVSFGNFPHSFTSSHTPTHVYTLHTKLKPKAYAFKNKNASVIE